MKSGDGPRMCGSPWKKSLGLTIYILDCHLQNDNTVQFIWSTLGHLPRIEGSCRRIRCFFKNANFINVQAFIICCSLMHIGLAMERTFFWSGVEKLIIHHMVAGWATIAEALEAKGSWLVGFFEQFAQRWLSWHMPFIWFLNNRWTKAGNCGKIMAGICWLALPFYPSEWLGVTRPVKNNKQGIVLQGFPGFFHKSGCNFDCPFCILFIKGIRGFRWKRLLGLWLGCVSMCMCVYIYQGWEEGIVLCPWHSNHCLGGQYWQCDKGLENVSVRVKLKLKSHYLFSSLL